MRTDGLYNIIITAICVIPGVLSAAADITKLKVREGLTNYFLHCYNHGSALDVHQQISWFYSKDEITASHITTSNHSDNVSLIASWDGSEIQLTNPGAWALEHYQVGGKYSLRILNTSFPRDDGYFYCVDTDNTEVLRGFHIVVQVKIVAISILESSDADGSSILDVTEGSETRMSCQVRRANPPPQFTWTINYFPVENASYPVSDDVNLGLIAFVPDRELNGATVRCMADNNNGPSAVATTTLNVLHPPQVHVSWQNDLSVLTCTAKGNPEVYSFQHWQHRVRGKQVATMEGSTSGSTSVLHLPPSGYKHTGDYVCVVGNGIGDPQQASFYVQPKSVPVFELRSRSVWAVSGDRVDISVGFYSHPTFTSLVWERAGDLKSHKLEFHKEKPAFPSLNFKGTVAHLPGNATTLTFQAVETKDAGLYTVIVTNTEGVSSYSITLKVQDLQNQENSNRLEAEAVEEARPLARLSEEQTAARQGSSDDSTTSSSDSTRVAAAVTCASLGIIILVIVGVWLVRSGKLPLQVYGKRRGTEKTVTDTSATEGVTSEKMSEASVDGRSRTDDVFPSSVSCNTESTSASLSTISDKRFPYDSFPAVSNPNSISLTGQAYLPPGSLQSMV